MPAFLLGDIVLVADFLDPNGVNPKDRPCVVVAEPGPTPEEASYLVVAISTVIPEPIPDDHVLLPYYHPKHPVTGLNRRAAAICSWVASIEVGRIIRKLGTAPGRQLHRILAELERLSGPDEAEDQ